MNQHERNEFEAQVEIYQRDYGNYGVDANDYIDRVSNAQYEQYERQYDYLYEDDGEYEPEGY